MASEMAFATNDSDLSADNVFQLEFHCSRCGNGYPTELDIFERSAAIQRDSAKTMRIRGLNRDFRLFVHQSIR
jgi:hypothetical protein